MKLLVLKQRNDLNREIIFLTLNEGTTQNSRGVVLCMSLDFFHY